jgi:hypothetical protein
MVFHKTASQTEATKVEIVKKLSGSKTPLPFPIAGGTRRAHGHEDHLRRRASIFFSLLFFGKDSFDMFARPHVDSIPLIDPTSRSIDLLKLRKRT